MPYAKNKTRIVVGLKSGGVMFDFACHDGMEPFIGFLLAGASDCGKSQHSFLQRSLGRNGCVYGMCDVGFNRMSVSGVVSEKRGKARGRVFDSCDFDICGNKNLLALLAGNDGFFLG